MRRRDFVGLIGGAAAWPLAVRAQQRMARIAVLMNVADNLLERALLTAFRQRLKELGWAEGSNVQIDERWAAGESAIMQSHALELVSLRPDVILVRGNRGLTAIQNVTRAIPTVFVGLADPIGLGFVESLARPGGNITGFTIYEVSIVGKLLEMLKQIAPGVTRVVFMYHPDNLTAHGS